MANGRARHHQQDDDCQGQASSGAERQAHTSQALYRWSLLCRVFRLMSRISAARVLLPPVRLSVLRISSRSALSTVVPTGITTSVSDVAGAGVATALRAARCSAWITSPWHTM